MSIDMDIRSFSPEHRVFPNLKYIRKITRSIAFRICSTTPIHFQSLIIINSWHNIQLHSF
nr:hypothetical protein Iba_scaffold44549CG0010 [Ipomoea batatas]GME21330.1 hypothetical protein Iba_scaffold27485CG0050 [Ipomoea batatas]